MHRLINCKYFQCSSFTNSSRTLNTSTKHNIWQVKYLHFSLKSLTTPLPQYKWSGYLCNHVLHIGAKKLFLLIHTFFHHYTILLLKKGIRFTTTYFPPSGLQGKVVRLLLGPGMTLQLSYSSSGLLNWPIIYNKLLP